MQRIVTRDDWLTERRALLAAEKEFTRQRDALSSRRRDLPWVRVERPYLFDTDSGPAALPDLFDGKRQLIVYHFMFGPDWAEGCPSCSFWADNFEGIGIHLARRDTALVAVSKAPPGKLLAYRSRMRWTFPWVSSGDSGFNEDYGVSFGGEGGTYNYSQRTGNRAELPGTSVFVREGDQVYHTYSTYARGLDMLNGAYHFLDLTPLGRNEDDLPWPMAWVRRHDRYDNEGDTK
jgi:predicted dithiol-disulfide oxidoreductase (DUF899 family)